MEGGLDANVGVAGVDEEEERPAEGMLFSISSFLITRAPRRGMNESSTVPVSGSGVGSGLFLNVATAVNCLLPAPGEEGLGMGGGLAGGTLNRGTSPTMSLPLPPNVCRALRDVKSCCCWMLG